MATFTQLASGNWRVQVRRSGLYRAKTFPSKRQGKAWADTIEGQVAEVQARGYHLPKGLTIGAVLRLYREDTDMGVGWGREKRFIVGRLEQRLGEVHAADLGAVHLQDFISGRLRDGAGGSTIGADLSTLATALEWAREVRRLDLHPERVREARRGLKYRKNLSTRSSERTRRPTTEELDRLIAHFEANPRQKIPVGILIRFAVASGMRLGEICRIEAADVDPLKRTVVIRRRKHPDPRVKEANDQEVPLLGEAWTIAAARMKEGFTGRLFPYTADTISSIFPRACRKLGIRDLHFHDLRHEGLSRLFEAGYAIPEVALVSGHRSWTNLKRYTQLRPEDLHRHPPIDTRR